MISNDKYMYVLQKKKKKKVLATCTVLDYLRLVMALVYCCSLDGLIASIVLLICTSLWIKASAK